jgi:hypothetical protein
MITPKPQPETAPCGTDASGQVLKNARSTDSWRPLRDLERAGPIALLVRGRAPADR